MCTMLVAAREAFWSIILLALPALDSLQPGLPLKKWHCEAQLTAPHLSPCHTAGMSIDTNYQALY